ncbi:MAG: S8 family peptidase, partial [Gammaproteobacteria bacterium]
MKKFKQIITICFFAIALAHCGGGGKGSSTQPTSPNNAGTPQNSQSNSSQTQSSQDSSSSDSTASYVELMTKFTSSVEYINQYGLSMINAADSYANNLSGDGTTIGIMDSGIETNHVELDSQNKITTDSVLDYSNFSGYRAPTSDDKTHGTFVASIAAGDRDESNNPNDIQGVAYNAQIHFIAIPLAEPDDDYDPVEVTEDNAEDYSGLDQSYAAFYKDFTSRYVTAVNNSYGMQGNIADYEESAVRASFPTVIETIAQQNKINKTIFVWSAGNAGGYSDQQVDNSSPEIFPGMVYFIEELQDTSVAVVSVNEEGLIADHSNRCGLAKDFCIAAPGENITGAYVTNEYPENNNYGTGSGTSFAAPFVSGAIALLTEKFKGQLTGQEILQRIYITANKEGVYSNSDIYGQGLLDLKKAIEPIGQTYFISPITNQVTTFSDANIFLSSPLFGSLNNLGDKLFLTYFDELGAPFSISASQLIRNNNPENSYLPRFPNSQLPTSGNEYLQLFSTIENYDFLSNQTTHKSGFSYALSLDPNNFFNLSLNQKNYYSSLSTSYDPIKNFVSNGPSIKYSFKDKRFGYGFSFSKGFQGWNPWTDQDKAYSKYFSTQLNIFSKNNKTSIKLGRLEEDSSYLGMMFLNGQSSSKNTYSSIITVDSDFINNENFSAFIKVKGMRA